MINQKARAVCWILFVALACLFAYTATHASEVEVGQKYQGSPVACREAKDAQLVADTFLKEGEKATMELVPKLMAENKCVAGVRFSFVVVKTVSKHENKTEAMYVIEVDSDGMKHHIINDLPAITKKKRNKNAEA